MMVMFLMIYGPKMCYKNLESIFSALENLGESKTRNFLQEKEFSQRDRDRESRPLKSTLVWEEFPRMSPWRMPTEIALMRKWFFNANRDVFIASCILQVFLLDFLHLLGTSSRRSWVICIRSRKAAISFARLAFIRKFVGQRDASGVSGNLAIVVGFKIYLTL